MGLHAFTEPSPSDWDDIETTVIHEQLHPYHAARKHGFTLSALKRSDPERHAHLLALCRDEDRVFVRDKLRANVEQSMTSDPPRGDVANKALELLGKQAGMFEETQRVEIEHGGTLDINNPDVAQAIERFTAGVVQLAERRRASLPAGDAAA